MKKGKLQGNWKRVADEQSWPLTPNPTWLDIDAAREASEFALKAHETGAALTPMGMTPNLLHAILWIAAGRKLPERPKGAKP